MRQTTARAFWGLIRNADRITLHLSKQENGPLVRRATWMRPPPRYQSLRGAFARSNFSFTVHVTVTTPVALVLLKPKKEGAKLCPELSRSMDFESTTRR